MIKLPKLNNPSEGFTLIELMVVVTILAILAVVGFAVFTNAQAIARDGIRRQEIASLAKSIETSKDPTVASYTYSNTTYTAEYPNVNSRPKDPYKDATKTQYCYDTDANAMPNDPSAAEATAWTGASCTPNYAVFINNTGAITATAINGSRYWKICAKLEVPGSAFCQGNIR